MITLFNRFVVFTSLSSDGCTLSDRVSPRTPTSSATRCVCWLLLPHLNVLMTYKLRGHGFNTLLVLQPGLVGARNFDGDMRFVSKGTPTGRPLAARSTLSGPTLPM